MCLGREEGKEGEERGGGCVFGCIVSIYASFLSCSFGIWVNARLSSFATYE